MDKDFLEKIFSLFPGHIYAKDKNGVYLYCNQRQATSLGFRSAKEIIGRTDFEISPTQEEAQVFWENDQDVMRTRTTQIKEESALYQEERSVMRSYKTPLEDEMGSVIGILGISFNITKEKQLDKKLKFAHKRTRLTERILHRMAEEVTGIKITTHKSPEECIKIVRDYFENMIALMPGHIYWINLDNKYMGCNNLQAIDGGLSSRKEMIGKTNEDMPWKDQATNIVKVNKEVMRTGKTLLVEEASTLANGKYTKFLSHKTPLRDENGNVIGLLGVSLDTSELKAAQEELKIAKEKAEAANTAKTNFIANISHDVRTPLSGILGIAELLENRVQTTEEKYLVENLMQSSKQLLELFNEILEISKFESGQLPISITKFNLREVIKTIADLMKSELIHKQLALIIDYPETVPTWLKSDKLRVHRILLNLIGNALKFTDEGHVRIGIRVLQDENKQSQLRIEIEDTGIGIPKEKCKMIFERFSRVIPSYQDKRKGIGLGLHIVQEMVNALKGRITVKSQEKVGSNFICVIPIKVCSQQETEKLVKKTQPIENKKGSLQISNVLLVEDDRMCQFVTQELLKDMGFNVDIASSSEEVFRQIEKSYDLILMDIGLSSSDEDGLSIARKIRQQKNGKNRHTLIVALTGHINEDEAKKCFENGMNHVLTKPLNRTKLIEFLRSIERSSGK